MDITKFTKPASTFWKAEEVIKSPSAVFVITTEPVLHESEYKGQKMQKLRIEGEFDKQPRIFDMSKTNARKVQDKLGPDTKTWVGHTLVPQTYKTKTTEGKLVDAIDIKEVK